MVCLSCSKAPFSPQYNGYKHQTSLVETVGGVNAITVNIPSREVVVEGKQGGRLPGVQGCLRDFSMWKLES